MQKVFDMKWVKKEMRLASWLVLGFYLIVSIEPPLAAAAQQSNDMANSAEQANTPLGNRDIVTREPVKKGALAVKEVHLIGKHDGYVVDVRYPFFSRAQGDVSKKLNKLAKHIVNTNIPAERSKTNIPNLYSCICKIHYLDEGLLSMEFDFEQKKSDSVSCISKTMNLAISSGLKEITLNEVFPPTTKPKIKKKSIDVLNYELLSDLCIEDLEHRLKEHLSLPQNTSIINEEFIPSFNFCRDGIKLYFPSGHVAAAKMGRQAAFIKYSRLQALINKRSRIYRLARSNFQRGKKSILIPSCKEPALDSSTELLL